MVFEPKSGVGMVEDDYAGEAPVFEFVAGLADIKVELINMTGRPLESLYEMVMATWGNAPDKRKVAGPSQMLEVVEHALEGKTLGNALESINFTFAISGITRATTHQVVRTRVGAGYAQQGGRDNDWRHNAARIPVTVARNGQLANRYKKVVKIARDLYADLLDAGIPYQDARFVLPIGTCTYIIETINYRALQGLLWNRLCRNMQWEIREVARQMRECVHAVTPVLGKYLICSCEAKGICTYGGRLFPPCGDWPLSNATLDGVYRFPRDMNGSVLEHK